MYGMGLRETESGINEWHSEGIPWENCSQDSVASTGPFECKLLQFQGLYLGLDAF